MEISTHVGPAGNIGKGEEEKKKEGWEVEILLSAGGCKCQVPAKNKYNLYDIWLYGMVWYGIVWYSMVSCKCQERNPLHMASMVTAHWSVMSVANGKVYYGIVW